jgi:hypothetical protein
MAKAATSNKIPVPDAKIVQNYNYDDGLIDTESYGYSTYHAPCYIIESCYTSRTLQEWKRSQPRGIQKMWPRSKSKYTLPEPGAYRPIEIFFRQQLSYYLSKKCRSGQNPFGLARDKDGFLITTSPGCRIILVRNPVEVIRSTSIHADRPRIKAVVQQEVLAQKEFTWAAQRAALQDKSVRKGGTSSRGTSRKGSTSSQNIA